VAIQHPVEGSYGRNDSGQATGLKDLPGYLATPKAGSSAHGFVVIQEWWGLNDQIKKTADRLAEAGYLAAQATRRPFRNHGIVPLPASTSVPLPSNPGIAGRGFLKP
jgi:Dienelactone hydrolase family